MTIEERRSTAIHEAGHIVVAWTLDLPVGSMEIGCNGDDTAGKSEIDDKVRPLSMVDRIAVCAAGVLAQRLFRCGSTHRHAGAGDYAKIIKMLDGLPEEVADAIKSKGYARASEILDEQQSLIEGIAEQLVVRGGRLEPDEVRLLLAGG